MTAPNLRPPLYETHQAAGARIIPFAGWEMPVQYPAGIIAETRAVRTAAGLFDVSHMGRLYISGPQAPALLDHILTASAATLPPGKARYSLICDPAGGIIDDAILYRLPPTTDANPNYLLIPNAGNRHRVLAWLQNNLTPYPPNSVTITDRTAETALIACQGPQARAIANNLTEPIIPPLPPFACAQTRLTNCGPASGAPALIARTGYTGEDGVEILTQAEAAVPLWQALTAAGATPCGLGARDVLRTEAGLPLHGQELDHTTTPIEARLDRFIDFTKNFVGRDVLQQQQRRGPLQTLIGLQLPGRSAPRPGYGLTRQDQPAGRITSGCYSPTLDTSIAIGYVLSEFSQPGTILELDKRGVKQPITVTALPHYRRPRARRQTPAEISP